MALYLHVRSIYFNSGRIIGLVRMRKKVSTVLSFLLVLAFLRPLTKLRWWGKKEEKRARSSSLSPILCVFGGSGNWHCLIWNRAKMWSENSTSRLSKFSGDWRWSWCNLGRILLVGCNSMDHIDHWGLSSLRPNIKFAPLLFYVHSHYLCSGSQFFFFLLEFLPTTP